MQYVSTGWELFKAGVPLALFAVAAYVVYVAVTKGLPAAKALVVGWWNKGKVTEQRLVALEEKVFGKPAPAAGASGATGPSK